MREGGLFRKETARGEEKGQGGRTASRYEGEMLKLGNIEQMGAYCQGLNTYCAYCHGAYCHEKRGKCMHGKFPAKNTVYIPYLPCTDK
jgi:hypothetical protein